MKEFNVVIFRKVMNSPTDESKGFEVVFYDRWRGLTNFRKAMGWLDERVPDWWYINVYRRPDRNYVGRIYTDTRRYQHMI